MLQQREADCCDVLHPGIVLQLILLPPAISHVLLAATLRVQTDFLFSTIRTAALIIFVAHNIIRTPLLLYVSLSYSDWLLKGQFGL